MTLPAAALRDPVQQPMPAASGRPEQPRRWATPATLRTLRWTVFIAAFTATVLQLTLLFTTANLATSALIVAGNALGYGYALRQSTLQRYPISTLMLLGYTFSYFTLPPLGQLLGLQPVTHHLYFPVIDLAYAVIGLLALIGGHQLYSNGSLLIALRGILRKQFYGRLGFYRVPHFSQLWLMGAIGVIAVLFGDHFDVRGSGILQAVMQGLHPFVYVPYITLLLPAWSPPRRIPRVNGLALVFYTGALLVLAMIVNSRAYLLMGFASLLIVYFFLLATGQMPLPNVSPRKIALAAFAILLIAGPVSEMAMAMVLVRGERTDMTPSQLVLKTWETFRSGHIAQRFARISAAMAGGRGINEDYFDNLYLNRLANLKFVDNAVDNQQALGPGAASYFAQIEKQKVISILPSPMISLLGLDANKRLVTSGSSGDFLLYAVSGDPYAIGGFRSGSLLVNLDIVFGYLWPLLLLLLSALIFAVVDAWCWAGPAESTGEWTARFNPLVIGMLFSESFFFTSAATGTESISGIMGVLMRGWIQIAVLYAVAFWLTRVLSVWRRS
ncbi:hypothetical protein MQE22_01385 [Acidithiobacillus sp. YTS05]|uniref:O-antigen polysaccharide polymerase Wzy n=1 Tax=Igneacidithiobacillus copahuensis TaxID=2724909 RepID=A0AAE2YQ84_9PROT|nr:hypothetical protein [Igneacidithiobacillus copahuensis]MBU2788023.1 hypothetical protein [Igneacidithiobacillus copahuensis]MBU2796617.1 hypothetical protein [Acidithiobacillus sp. VAN18-2]UTV81295.1 hypothetical protein MQE22_01385 [Acidithiobacillus sp. YTS05]